MKKKKHTQTQSDNMDLDKEEKRRLQLEKISRCFNFNRHIAFNKKSKIEHDDEAEIQGSISVPKQKLFPFLEQLYSKKTSVRETALKTLVEEFEWNVRTEFAENNFVTLVHRCQNCLRGGSNLEIDLALRLIGLVALTLGAGDNAHEIYEESLVFLPSFLKAKPSHSAQVIECLSIVTLVGASYFVDTERSMEIIWQFMNHESMPNGTKHPSSVTAAAISGWALLLSDIDGWRIDHKKWKGLIPYLLKQLDEDDEDVNAASIEAIALIFENGSLEKFSDQAEQHERARDMKDDIIKHVKRACNGTQKNASKILKDSYNKTTTLTLCRRTLSFTTWSQLKKLSFIRRFLGFGFTNHMVENKHLHDIFHFVPATKNSRGRLYRPEFDEVVVRVFLPDVPRDTCRKWIHMSPNSLLNKGRAKLMNKYRMLAEESKAGYFIADGELD